MSKSQIKEAVTSLVRVSRYSDDIAHDLKFIYSDRIHHYGKNADEFELYRIKKHYELLSQFSIVPENKNRIYVVTGMECIMAICLDISDTSKDKIIDSLKLETKLSDPFPSYTVEPNFITTLYVFTDDKAVYSVDLFPYWIGVLVQSFRKKNIIRHGDCEHWLD